MFPEDGISVGLGPEPDVITPENQVPSPSEDVHDKAPSSDAQHQHHHQHHHHHQQHQHQHHTAHEEGDEGDGGEGGDHHHDHHHHHQQHQQLVPFAHQQHQHHHQQHHHILHATLHHNGTIMGHTALDHAFQDTSAFGEVEASQIMGFGGEALYGAPERKRRKVFATDQSAKRFRYDVLKCFFRIYFQIDDKACVLKDAVFNLYTRKIPTDSQIARNAFYRNMWNFFRDRVSCSQSNYRDYVRGLRLTSSPPQNPTFFIGLEKEFDLLRQIGVTSFFDFTEEDITKEKTIIIPLPPPLPPPLPLSLPSSLSSSDPSSTIVSDPSSVAATSSVSNNNSTAASSSSAVPSFDHISSAPVSVSTSATATTSSSSSGSSSASSSSSSAILLSSSGAAANASALSHSNGIEGDGSDHQHHHHLLLDHSAPLEDADVLILLDQIEHQAKILFSSIHGLRQRLLKRKELEDDLS